MYFSIMFLENGNLIIQSQVLRLEREEGGQVLHKLWRRTLTFYKSLLEVIVNMMPPRNYFHVPFIFA